VANIIRGTLLPWALEVSIALLAATWRIQRCHGQLLRQAQAEGSIVVAFFHGDQLPLVALHRGEDLVGMASRSADGELLARVIQRFGYGAVRGSSSRGGVAAGLRAIKGVLEEGRSLALAVDGPRGPRRVPQRGAVSIAAMSGRPVVFAVVRARPAWRAGSWDSFVVPWPFARVEVRYGRMDISGRGKQAAQRNAEELGRRMRALADEP